MANSSGDHRSQIELGPTAGENADQRDGTASANGKERLLETPGTAHFDDEIGADLRGALAYLPAAVWNFAIVDALGCAELGEALEQRTLRGGSGPARISADFRWHVTRRSLRVRHEAFLRELLAEEPLHARQQRA